MPHICVTSPIPSMNQIMGSFSSLLTYPPSLPAIAIPQIQIPPFPGMQDLQKLLPFPSIPKLPSAVLALLGLPDPLFDSLHLPNIEFATIAMQLQSFQLQNTLLNMMKPMLDLLGLDITTFLPRLPYLSGFTLLDLLSGDVTQLVAAIKQAVTDMVHIPVVPDPIFGSLIAKAVAIPHTLMTLTSNYLQTITTAIIALIKKVTDKLKIPAMPALPEFPTFESVLTALMNAVNAKLGSLHLPDLTLNVPDFPGLLSMILPRIPAIPGMPNLSTLDLAALLVSLVFPGFPALPLLPDPLIPAFNIPSINLSMAVTILMHHLTTGLLEPIMDFIQKTLSKFLTFTFPLICIDF